jgi:hypothetical protein
MQPNPTVSLLSPWMLSAAGCLAQVQLPPVTLGETNFEGGYARPGWLLEEFQERYVAREQAAEAYSVVFGRNRSKQFLALAALRPYDWPAAYPHSRWR